MKGTKALEAYDILNPEASLLFLSISFENKVAPYFINSVNLLILSIFKLVEI